LLGSREADLSARIKSKRQCDWYDTFIACSLTSLLRSSSGHWISPLCIRKKRWEARREAGLNEPRLVSLHNIIIDIIDIIIIIVTITIIILNNNNNKVFAFCLFRSFFWFVHCSALPDK
jgi:hypothetical protein